MNAKDRAIAGALGLAILGSLGFMAAYVLHASIQAEGLALAVALLGFAIAAIGWANWIIGDDRVIDQIEEYPSDSADRSAAVDELEQTEEEVTRRGGLVKLLYAALGIFGIAALFPFRSWGPAPDGALFKTKWKPGDRLVRENGEILTKDALNVDSIVTVFPEGAIGDASSQTVLIRLPDGVGQSVDGYIAYSKICTHAGCPVALYRAAAHQLMCPCHQSVFDVADAGKVLSGPADHALPQLPLEVDSAGYLRAKGDYPVPVGPGFWERG
ncbi:MAG TPA: Rieske 2Fe-2S domain-containing protein [Candidatus Baltobacteraceae bacterium]|jgi:ubiquinol-cytochrome c reductase iron-sulfur subunit